MDYVLEANVKRLKYYMLGRHISEFKPDEAYYGNTSVTHFHPTKDEQVIYAVPRIEQGGAKSFKYISKTGVITKNIFSCFNGYPTEGLNRCILRPENEIL
jgi:hypothetical protein